MRDQERVRLEALTYPDTPLANQAKIAAAKNLGSNRERRSDALALCNQIVDSKREKDPITLASAYYERLHNRISRPLDRSDVSELERVLTLIASAPRQKVNDFDSAVLKWGFGSRAGYLAISVCMDAIRIKDYDFGVRALKVAEQLKDMSDPYSVKELKDLKDELEKQKNAPLSKSKEQLSVR